MSGGESFHETGKNGSDGRRVAYNRGVSGLEIKGFRLSWADGLPEFFTSAVECEHVSGLDIDGFSGRQASPEGDVAAVSLNGCDSYSIRNSTAAAGTGVFLSASGPSAARMLFGNDLSQSRRAAGPDAPVFSPSQNLLPGNGEHENPSQTASRPG